MADGSDHGKADKLKFKRAQTWKKFSRYLVLYCLPVTFCLAVLWICFNLEATVPPLPLLWPVKITKVWHFCSSRWFLFLLINVIVASLLVMAGSRCPSNGSKDFYDEYVRRNENAPKYYVSLSLPVLAEKDDKNPANSKAIVSISSSRTNSETTATATATPTSLGGTCAKPRSRKPSRPVFLEMTQRRETSEEATNSLSLIEVPSNEEEAAYSPCLIEVPSNEEEATNCLSLIEAPSNEEIARNSLSLIEGPSNEEAMLDEELQRRSDELQRRSDEFIAKFKGQIWQENMELSGK